MPMGVETGEGAGSGRGEVSLLVLGSGCSCVVEESTLILSLKVIAKELIM